MGASVLRAARLGLLVVGIPAAAWGQTASVRGSVVDESGKPIADVKLELEYKGESRQKIVRTATTDKKGGFVRVGLLSGQWQLRFSKDGYQPHGMETNLSFGGVSELPPITLRPAVARAPAGQGQAGAALDTPAPSGAPELGQIYAKALEAMKAGNSAEAEALFKQVVEQAPDVASAHYNIGYLAMQRKDVPLAEASFRKAIELRPQQANAYIALATLLGSAERVADAYALLQGAAGSFGEDAKYQFALGVAAINTGHEAEALPALTKAVELDPTIGEAHYYLGTLAVGRNEIPAAVSSLEKYLELAPQGPNAPVAQKLLAALKARK